MTRGGKRRILQIVFAALALVLAGSAHAAGWRSLRVDASSEASYSESMATFREKLSPSRRVAFALALQDVWREGAQRAYTTADYLRELDGLKYDEVVRLTDPTGKKAKQYRAAYYYAQALRGPPAAHPGWVQSYREPVSGGEWRGQPTLGGVPGRDGR